MKCPYCHQTHPDDALFCTVTGWSLAVVPPAGVVTDRSSKTCPNCGKQVTYEMNFCVHCGGSLKSKSPEKLLKAEKTRVPSKREGVGIKILIAVIIFSFALILSGLYLAGIIPARIMGFSFNHTPIASLDAPISQSTVVLEIGEAALADPTISTKTLSTKEAVTAMADNNIVALPIETIVPETKKMVISVNEIDQAEMVFIPTGEFVMGSDPETDRYFWGSESPPHTVQMDGYWIYRYEVTNAMYQLCDDADVCSRPKSTASRTRDSYYGNPEYDNYPVIHVTYGDASTYCNWVGGRLPTEAEWERAARGDEGDRTFPWGDTAAEGIQANFCDYGCPESGGSHNQQDGYGETAPVGSYPAGISPFGLFDVAGNVWEWVFDYFSDDYYVVSPDENPIGPATSAYRVIRGGGWSNPSSGVRVVQRSGLSPSKNLDTLGFRCALDGD